MAKIVIPSVDRLKEWVGKEVAVSDWFAVTQERIDAFAAATEDDQWIHVDRERAARESPYATTVAHGFLTLSLLPYLMREAVDIVGARMGINYGLNRARFTGPVPAGSRVRARFVLASVEEIEGGVQSVWSVTVEREGEAKPALVAEWVTRRYK
jgi:acyl dehydratase